MPNRYDQFVHDENVQKFRRQIEAETDEARLKVLKALLREEEAKVPYPWHATESNPPKRG